MSFTHSYIINKVADYYLDQQTTIRQCAIHFGLSKSTIHNYLHTYLKKIDPQKYKKVSALSQLNFSQKHLRGGDATRQKFRQS